MLLREQCDIAYMSEVTACVNMVFILFLTGLFKLMSKFSS